jgi:hypothetical protein
MRDEGFLSLSFHMVDDIEQIDITYGTSSTQTTKLLRSLLATLDRIITVIQQDISSGFHNDVKLT